MRITLKKKLSFADENEKSETSHNSLNQDHPSEKITKSSRLQQSALT